MGRSASGLCLLEQGIAASGSFWALFAWELALCYQSKEDENEKQEDEN